MNREMFELAARMALPTTENDPRGFYVGSAAMRSDNAIVKAKNIASKAAASDNHKRNVYSHSEGKLSRFLDTGSIVFVARVSRLDFRVRLAKPCVLCHSLLKNKKVRKVFYTIGDCEYGCIDFENNRERVYDCKSFGQFLPKV